MMLTWQVFQLTWNPLTAQVMSDSPELTTATGPHYDEIDQFAALRTRTEKHIAYCKCTGWHMSLPGLVYARRLD